jgi:hypothetical protein
VSFLLRRITPESFFTPRRANLGVEGFFVAIVPPDAAEPASFPRIRAESRGDPVHFTAFERFRR